jgi:hypothetical protein
MASRQSFRNFLCTETAVQVVFQGSPLRSAFYLKESRSLRRRTLINSTGYLVPMMHRFLDNPSRTKVFSCKMWSKAMGSSTISTPLHCRDRMCRTSYLSTRLTLRPPKAKTCHVIKNCDSVWFLQLSEDAKEYYAKFWSPALPRKPTVRPTIFQSVTKSSRALSNCRSPFALYYSEFR